MPPLFRFAMTQAALVALFALALFDQAALAQEQDFTRSVTVTGLGEVSAKPDQAQLSVGVMTTGKTAKEALDQNNGAMMGLFESMDAAGIPEQDIQTSNFSVSPRYARYNDRETPPDIVGYNVSNTVRITVRDLDGLGRYIDQFVQTGANTLNGIQFGLSDPAAKQNEARIKAIEDAHAKAKLYAEAAGAQLGQVLVIQETASPMPIPMMARMSLGAAEAVPMAPGQQTITARITVTYALD